MSNYLLLIYPVIIVIMLFWGCSFRRKDEYYEEAWSLTQSKALRAVAALMIILHHMVQSITRYGDVKKGPITEWNSFGILFTSVFFFFSGFGLYKSYKTKENYLEGFLTKRLPKIILPFLVTNIIYIVTLYSEDRISEVRHMFTSILGFTLINTNAWFIVVLIILYVAFYFCFKKSKTESGAFAKLLIFAIILILICLLLGHDNSNVNGHWFMGEWWYNTTLIFMMGMYFARFETKIKAFVKKRYVILLPLSIAIFVGWYILEEYVINTFGYYQEWKYHPGYPEKLLSLVTQIILCILFMFVLLLVNMKIEFKNKALKFLGGICFEVYLIHDVFRWSFFKGLDGDMTDAEYMLLTFAASIVCAWLLSLADTFILNYYNDYSEYFLSFKKPRFNDDTTFEAMHKKYRIWSIIQGFKYVYVIAFIGMLVFEGLAVYRYIYANTTQVSEERDALRSAKVGDTVYFGNIIQDYNKNKEEPISWIVCDVQEGHVLLVSEKVLYDFPYHKYHDNTTWKDSKLCRMLNHDFYSSAFSKEEKKMLCGKKDENNPDWDITDKEAFTYYINKSEEDDYEDIKVETELVFILSKEETEKYMPSAEDRIAVATKAVQSQGIGNRNNGYKAPWWITDMGTGKLKAMYVETDGNIDTEGKTINNSGMGVRPAIWVKVK